MPCYVALFRGINVGKAKRIAMADLKALLGELGFTNAQTLLNSGNAVFTGKAEPATRIAARIRKAVHLQLGVDSFVIVKTGKDISAVIADNQLEGVATDHSRLLVTVTGAPPALAALAAVARQDWGAEKIHVGEHAAYVWCANGILESKAIPALFKLLKDQGTSRNWATLKKIHALMESA